MGEGFMADVDFVVGVDEFEDIVVHPTQWQGYHWFSHRKKNQRIKLFVLSTSKQVFHSCGVTLIKKGDRFTPRVHFTVRHLKPGKTIASAKISLSDGTRDVKASVDLSECYENFWKLISYFKSMEDIDIPGGRFRLAMKKVGQIVADLSGYNPETIKKILQSLSSVSGVALTEKDVNELLHRKERLKKFETGLTKEVTEPQWQKFFDDNKWIFGYGLNYVVLRIEHSQADVGGVNLTGAGTKIPDYMTTTSGALRFTVPVEIKTARTPLISGTKPIRSGAWSISKELTDAVVQLQAVIDEWTNYSSKRPENIELLSKNTYTVTPKGIVVLGHLDSLESNLQKIASFERFRQSVHGIEIITFDELYERARFIAEHQA
jgi:Domain of unknown function (DUF4263)